MMYGNTVLLFTINLDAGQVLILYNCIIVLLILYKRMTLTIRTRENKGERTRLCKRNAALNDFEIRN